MRDPKLVEMLVEVVSEWVAKAENDLKTATHMLKLGRECPTDIVCFHVQQCVEKYLKAHLASLSVAFPKTHNIKELLLLTPGNARPNINVQEQDLLTKYAVAGRYPGWSEVPLPEARRALALARRVRKHVRDLLPGEALRRRKP